jgi:NADH:ubiquinone oxidoreductase subunit 2 (subunit N)
MKKSNYILWIINNLIIGVISIIILPNAVLSLAFPNQKTTPFLTLIPSKQEMLSSVFQVISLVGYIIFSNYYLLRQKEKKDRGLYYYLSGVIIIVGMVLFKVYQKLT